MEQSDVTLEHAVDPPPSKDTEHAPTNGSQTTGGESGTNAHQNSPYKWEEYLAYKDPDEYLDKQSVVCDVS